MLSYGALCDGLVLGDLLPLSEQGYDQPELELLVNRTKGCLTSTSN
jgi:hypothetical protein